jgi:hypothetical protein
MPPINPNSRGGYVTDVVVSFAAEDGWFAELLQRHLQALRCSVGMDLVDERRILAFDAVEYVAPIYAWAGRVVVVILGQEHGLESWELIASSGLSNSGYAPVIPVWSTEIPRAEAVRVSPAPALIFQPTGDLDEQAGQIAAEIEKLLVQRNQRF